MKLIKRHNYFFNLFGRKRLELVTNSSYVADRNGTIIHGAQEQFIPFIDISEQCGTQVFRFFVQENVLRKSI